MKQLHSQTVKPSSRAFLQKQSIFILFSLISGVKINKIRSLNSKVYKFI